MKAVKNITSTELLKKYIKNNINPITGWKADTVKEDYNN
tara:strand:+ start:119 stop:235 length:117 start_codon:yes stop_codon:yes gene_type:complete